MTRVEVLIYIQDYRNSNHVCVYWMGGKVYQPAEGSDPFLQHNHESPVTRSKSVSQ